MMYLTDPKPTAVGGGGTGTVMGTTFNSAHLSRCSGVHLASRCSTYTCKLKIEIIEFSALAGTLPSFWLVCRLTPILSREASTPTESRVPSMILIQIEEHTRALANLVVAVVQFHVMWWILSLSFPVSWTDAVTRFGEG